MVQPGDTLVINRIGAKTGESVRRDRTYPTFSPLFSVFLDRRRSFGSACLIRDWPLNRLIVIGRITYRVESAERFS